MLDLHAAGNHRHQVGGPDVWVVLDYEFGGAEIPGERGDALAIQGAVSARTWPAPSNLPWSVIIKHDVGFSANQDANKVLPLRRIAAASHEVFLPAPRLHFPLHGLSAGGDVLASDHSPAPEEPVLAIL